jgi:multiple sugar transport system substrate-binding protein
MQTVKLKGLIWGHRRAVGPAEALSEQFCRTHSTTQIEWTVRSLASFEHQSLDMLARDYDLIVYDHPFSGSLVETAAFAPLTPEMDLPLGTQDAAMWAGPSLASYRFGGSVWGLPIDAATQHAAYRSDLLDKTGKAVPENWLQVLELGKALKDEDLYLGMAALAPHAVLVIAALMANMGKPWSTDPDLPFSIDQAAFLEAYEMLAEFMQYVPQEALGWNAIDLHDAMIARDDIVYCPCVYGYATYGEADYNHRLSFADFAGTMEPYHAGTVLGGAAMGLSRGCRHMDEAITFLRFAASERAQTEQIAMHHGQPARIEAWDDPAVNQRFNGFFSATRQTIETAWTRPRFCGYPKFQQDAGEIVARTLAENRGAEAAWNEIHPLLKTVNS